jgi:phage terminase large subunit GpA-like protein
LDTSRRDSNRGETSAKNAKRAVPNRHRRSDARGTWRERSERYRNGDHTFAVAVSSIRAMRNENTAAIIECVRWEISAVERRGGSAWIVQS